MCQGRDAVEGEDAGEGPQRVEALAGQADAAHEPQQGHPPSDANDRADAHLHGELTGPIHNAALLRPPAGNRLTINAMPTGSLAPDSPSRIVAERPAISLAKHGEHDRGVGGRDRRPDQHSDIPAEAEP